MALMLVFANSLVSLADDDKDKKAEVSDEIERLTESTNTVRDVLGIPENGIPQDMLDNAAAVVVIPDLIKAAFIAGAKNGDGVMAVRDASGWTLPTFVEMTGGSVGWQIGVEETDLVLVFMDEKHVKKLLNGEFTFGADASVAVGPVGRQASAGTNQNAKSAVYAYSRSKGVFAGVSLDGSKIYIDKEANARVYGAGTTPSDVLYGQKVKAPKEAADFKLTLNSMTKPNMKAKP